ncbi:MAG TPA: hypothetical protein VGJ15_04030 [Pirellulales bacterium]
MNRDTFRQGQKSQRRAKGKRAEIEMGMKPQRPNKLSRQEVEHLRHIQGSGHS